jgi:hypothetical protein
MRTHGCVHFDGRLRAMQSASKIGQERPIDDKDGRMLLLST